MKTYFLITASGKLGKGFWILLLLLLIPIFGLFTIKSFAQTVAVYASVETTPVLHALDAADDMAIWIHPTDSSLSTIIGTDKKGNLEVYDLTGNVLQRIPFLTNNVDLRYNFPLSGEKVALVTGIDRTAHKLFAFKVNPDTRLLEDVSSPAPSIIGLIGSAMYVSPITGKYYAFLNYKSVLKQYELYDNGSGRVGVNLVRSVPFGSLICETEGVVADDVYGKVYVSEETVAIWKLGAEPGDGDAKVMVDQPLAQGGHFQPEIEGLTIYYKSDHTGYLIGSSQGNSTFTVYQREGDNAYLGTFNIAEGAIDKVTGTDGIDVTNLPLGSAFPYGLFVAQDGTNKDGGVQVNQNFKLVPFERIASSMNLTMDTSWDPRLVGVVPFPTPTPPASPTPTLTLTPEGTPSPSPTPTETPTPTPVPSILTFTPTADAYTNSNRPTRNYGADLSLQTDGSPIKNFYLKFAVSGTAGQQILSAKLRLYNLDPSDKGGSVMLVPDNSWSEFTITYNNAPPASGSVIGSLGRVVANTWYEFDITPVINGDGIYSLRISSSSVNGADYSSKEGAAGFNPSLVIALIP